MKRTKLSAACIMVLASSLLYSSVSLATAWAESGYSWWGDVLTPTGCVGMYLNSSVQTGYPNGSQTVDGNSWVSARQCTDQNPQLIYLPAGWIGVFSENYKNGGYCGGSGWKYSAFTQATWSASTQACKNTSGTQLYNNRTHGQIWNGSGYVQYGGQNSPSVSN